ncbi:hypothetical protein MNBD_NITROSPINAE04-1218 [hydrothermal vent metagenome]|uniref:Uncharacterized protein n=1 Tax=hydrothermal vent metagenome TaxID=652676 RepID=A0A3B1CC11_9ZZZZ
MDKINNLLVKNRINICAGLVLFMILCLSPKSFAFELEWHGFTQAHTAAKTTAKYPGDKREDIFVGAEKLRLQLSGSSDDGAAGFTVKADLANDSVNNETYNDLREMYMDYSGNAFDLRVGRQIITWGVGDLLFINDVFPKDWQALFTGEPMEYMKLGSDAVKLNIYADTVTMELVVTPFFRQDNLPSSKIFISNASSSSLSYETQMPDHTFDNAETALRLSVPIFGFDSSLYAYRGFWRSPSGAPDDVSDPTLLIMSFSPLAEYGFSVQGNVATGVLSLEGGYYDSVDDRDGTDPFVPNSQWRYLVGFQKQFGADTVISAQYYGESMVNYEEYLNNAPESAMPVKQNHQYVTLRFTRFFIYQTLKFNVFGYYSPDEEDYYVIPEIRYTLTDGMWTAIGANIFGGKKEYTFFGQFDKNDNVYAVLRYEF